MQLFRTKGQKFLHCPTKKSYQGRVRVRTTCQNLGQEAGQNVGRDPGQDAGRDPGQDAGRDAGRDVGRDAGWNGTKFECL